MKISEAATTGSKASRLMNQVKNSRVAQAMIRAGQLNTEHVSKAVANADAQSSPCFELNGDGSLRVAADSKPRHSKS